MRRFIALVLALLLVISIAGCQKQTEITPPQNYEETIHVSIPASYCNFAGLEPEELAESLTSGEDASVVSAAADSGDVKIVATQSQIEQLIAQNNKNAERYIEKFLSASDQYRLEGSEDYSKLTLYCDENYGDQNLFVIIAVISNTYALNNILYNKNPDWDVTIKLVNCHTGKAVIEGSIRNDNMSINKKTWEQSYGNE